MPIVQEAKPWSAHAQDQSAWFNYGFTEQTFCQHINQYIKNQVASKANKRQASSGRRVVLEEFSDASHDSHKHNNKQP